MRYFTALTALLALAAPSPAAAQMYPGQNVTVNLSAAGTQVLLYPGGKYARIVHRLREPGEKNDGPIRLHMPARHRLARHAIHHPRAIAAAPQAEAPVAAPPPAQRAAPLSDFGDIEVMRPAKPVPQAAPARSEPKPAPPQQRTASVAPPPARIAPAPSATPKSSGAAKHSVILFAPNASDPSVSAIQTAKSLANDLNAALAGGSSRVQLLAYGGQRGDKSSDTRRLSLKRALIIRQLLIDNGVPSERIDVRALGGADDNGPADRVDVFLKS